jgi:hypothetical protein
VVRVAVAVLSKLESEKGGAELHNFLVGMMMMMGAWAMISKLVGEGEVREEFREEGRM